MTSCCGVHEDKISDNWAADGPILYKEHERNTIFINFKRTLFIIDSTNYIETCPQCKKYREIYIHGTWPDVRASFDGVTDLPIRANVQGINLYQVCIELSNEPSFGKFIFIYTHQNGDYYFIIYYPTGNIEQSVFKGCRSISVDGLPAICCQTIDRRFVIINSDGEVIDAKVVYPKVENDDEVVFEIGSGILCWRGRDLGWKYTANPALKTKAAARE
jgi:hypothetical protein